MVLPPGPLVFPLKESWNKSNLTLESKRASQLGPEIGAMGVFGCPPDAQEPEVGGAGPREGTDDADLAL
eukprot:13854669-Heterocapsa_arctica.AAC.1